MAINWNSRVVTMTGALLLSAAFGIGALAQTAGQTTQTQGQGRGGAAGAGGRGGGQAQQPARDTQAPTPGTGIISGRVTVDGTGTPVRRARVALTGTELRGGRSTITNDEGAFTFTALPAGRFSLTASRAGYIDSPYGAKKPGRPGTPIQLAAGQKMEKATIALPKGGVITGVVVDDSGEPAPRTQVRVLRYVMRTGEKTLQQAGTDQTDDRGIYRVYGLLPGDYMVSAVPQNMNIGDIRQTLAAEIESLMQQAQASGLGAMLGGRGGDPAGAGGGGGGGGRAGGGGGRGGGGVAGIDINQIMGGVRGGGDLLGRAQQLQDLIAQQEQEAAVAYAPVYYPGTPTPSQASPVTLAIAEERNGVDFRLTLVKTAKVAGSVQSPGGALPQGTQITLMQADQGPAVPGSTQNTTRVNQDGTFSFREIPPGQYRVMARGTVRVVDPNAPADAGRGGRGGGPGGQGPGGRGGPGGQIAQVLWGSADVGVNGEDVNGVMIALQEGMTVTGRVAFDSSAALNPDLTTVRINLTPRGAQQGPEFGIPPTSVDATGRFVVKGVLPGKYTINANVQGAGRGGAAAGGGGGRGGAAAATTTPTVNWTLKSAVIGGRDALDFGLVVEPNQDVTGTLLFADKTQEVSGTIQDTLGVPTADYFIVLFSADKSYWVPQARRIQSVRPGTDGKFTFRNLPPGDYRLTAVTDMEQGEQFDPNFLEQLASVSVPVLVREGEKKVQDIKVAAGGG